MRVGKKKLDGKELLESKDNWFQKLPGLSLWTYPSVIIFRSMIRLCGAIKGERYWRRALWTIKVIPHLFYLALLPVIVYISQQWPVTMWSKSYLSWHRDHSDSFYYNLITFFSSIQFSNLIWEVTNKCIKFDGLMTTLFWGVFVKSFILNILASLVVVNNLMTTINIYSRSNKYGNNDGRLLMRTKYSVHGLPLWPWITCGS